MKKLLFAAVAVSLGLMSCSSGLRTGNLSLYLTDMPTDAKALNINIEKIYLYPSDDGGDDMSEPVLIYDRANDPDPKMINLLELTDGKKELLVTESVPVGRYGQIRIILVDDTTLVLEGPTAEATDDVTETVKIPSRDLKVPYPISVDEGTWTKVTLDFDADKSLHMVEPGSDKYILTPVIHVVNVVFGTSEG